MPAAAEGGGLRLAFGAAPHGPLTEAKVAALVVAALEAQGLAPRWDGDASRRIGVPLQWRKRHLGASRPELLGAVNDPAPLEQVVQLLRVDSVHRPSALPIDGCTEAGQDFLLLGQCGAGTQRQGQAR